jgi:hypothetical protein
MAWEGRYSYRVRRVNGRVVRESCGNGLLAQLAAGLWSYRQAGRKSGGVEMMLAVEAPRL